MSKTQQTAGEKPRIGEQEVRRAAELLKKYRQGKVNLERRIIDNEQFWKLRHWPQMEKTGEGGNPGDPQPTSGWLVNCILSKHADAMDCYPEPTVLPREPGDRAEAAKLTRILPAILKKNQFKRTYSSAWWYKLKSGCAVYGVFWDAGIVLHHPGVLQHLRHKLRHLYLHALHDLEVPSIYRYQHEILLVLPASGDEHRFHLLLHLPAPFRPPGAGDTARTLCFPLLFSWPCPARSRRSRTPLARCTRRTGSQRREHPSSPRWSADPAGRQCRRSHGASR